MSYIHSVLTLRCILLVRLQMFQPTGSKQFHEWLIGQRAICTRPLHDHFDRNRTNIVRERLKNQCECTISDSFLAQLHKRNCHSIRHNRNSTTVVDCLCHVIGWQKWLYMCRMLLSSIQYFLAYLDGIFKAESYSFFMKQEGIKIPYWLYIYIYMKKKEQSFTKAA